MSHVPKSKVCSICQHNKPLESFSLRQDCALGVNSRCFECVRKLNVIYRRKHPEEVKAFQRAYNRTPRGKLMMCYHNMRGRVTGIQHKKAHLYEGLEILPRRTFYAWAFNDKSYNSIFSAWVKSGHIMSLAPSVNRIDSNKGYILANMEWVTHGENSRLGARSDKRVVLVKGV